MSIEPTTNFLTDISELVFSQISWNSTLFGASLVSTVTYCYQSVQYYREVNQELRVFMASLNELEQAVEWEEKELADTQNKASQGLISDKDLRSKAVERISILGMRMEQFLELKRKVTKISEKCPTVGPQLAALMQYRNLGNLNLRGIEVRGPRFIQLINDCIYGESPSPSAAGMMIFE